MITESERRRQVGRYGEMIGVETIKRMYPWTKYSGATNPCFDAEAVDENGQKFFIAMECRNHTTSNGKIKEDPYNLLCNRKSQDREAFEILRRENAIGIWLAVTIDAPRQRRDVRMGRINDLPNPRYIPMSAKARAERDNIIEENVFDPRIKPEWSNVRAKP
jgi:hypothetical protein